MFTKDSEDLIIDLDLDASTGYTSSTVNSASINNKGIEAIVNFIPVQSRDFTWEIAGQFSLLRSEVLTISDGVDQIYIGGKVGQGNIAIPGLPFGVMEGDIIKRDYGGLDGTDHTQVHWDDRENSLPCGVLMVTTNNLVLVLSVIQILTLFTVLLIHLRQVGNCEYNLIFIVGDVFSTTSSTLLGRGILRKQVLIGLFQL